MDYNANNILLGTQIASKLSTSVFNLSQIENANDLGLNVVKATYETTNQSVLDQINLRQGAFTPKPPLYFQLNLEGATPIKFNNIKLNIIKLFRVQFIKIASFSKIY